jgi:hypothetical protein
MSLLEGTRRCYEKIKKYSHDSGFDAKYNLNAFWSSDNMRDMLSIVYNSGSCEEVINRVDETFMYAINFPPECAPTGRYAHPHLDRPGIRERSIDWLLNDQVRRGVNLFSTPDHIQESKFVHPRNQILRNGRILTSNFLRTFSMSEQIAKYCKLENKRILELGAGCGYFARTFSLLNECSQYVIMDIPETLNFSFVFLNLEFPDKNILFVTEKEDFDRMDKFDFVLVPTCFVEYLKGQKFDLFVNTASMGEMQNNIIRFWMKFIQEDVTILNLYTCNRYLNTIKTGFEWRLEENECSVHYDSNWDILNWELEPSYCKCPYMDTLHARYVEILAKRPSVLTQDEKVKLSEKHLEDVRLQDWNRMTILFDYCIMTAGDNIISNDTTMTGTLFKLWESIRLNPTKEAIQLLLHYMSRLILSEKKMFEEQSYYEKLANELG